MADKNDYTDKFNTQLSPEKEAQFLAWAQKTGRTKDLYDYDMRGAWQAGAQQAENGHFTDQFKKPNHPTFSTESQYSGKQGFVGGKWDELPNGKWAYTASPTNLQFHPALALHDYFQQTEPDATLLLQH